MNLLRVACLSRALTTTGAKHYPLRPSQLTIGNRSHLRYQSTVLDQRETLSNQESEVITPHTLRPYQLECVETCLRLRQEGERRQLVSLPVGSGKTVVMSHIISRLSEPRPGANKVLVLAHREELLKQAKDQIARCSPNLSVEIDGVRIKASGKADVTCASIATLGRTAKSGSENEKLKKFDPKQFKMIIIDEAHHAPSGSYQRILEHFGVLEASSDILLWGCTATVNRHDGISLDTFTYLAYHKDFLKMIEENWLCRLRITTVETSVKLADVTLINADFNLEQLAKATNTPFRNKMVVKSYKKYAAGRLSTLVFATTLQHVRDLTQEFQKAGVDARYVTGDTDPDLRRSTLSAYRNREFPVLVNCGVFTEGTDLPTTDCVLMARPTRSEVLFLQMIGRGMRLHPDKKDCLVIDFVDNFRGKRLETIPSIMGLKTDVLVNGEELVEGGVTTSKTSAEPNKRQDEAPKKVLSAKDAKYFVSVCEYDDVSAMYGEHGEKDATQMDATRIHEIGLRNFSQQDFLREISVQDWVEVNDDVFILVFKPANKACITFRLRKTDGVYHASYQLQYNYSYTDVPLQDVNSLSLAIRASETFITRQFGHQALHPNPHWRKIRPTSAQMNYLGKRIPKQLLSEDLNRATAAEWVTRAKHGWVGRAKKYAREVLGAIEKEEKRKPKRTVAVGRMSPEKEEKRKPKRTVAVRRMSPVTEAEAD